MRRTSAHRDRRGGPSLRRLTAGALLAAAVLPVLGVGALVSLRLGTALQDDARLRAEQAAVAARALVARSTADLARLVDSYATWPRLATAIAAGDLEAVRTDVLAFLVERGSVSGAVAVVGDRSVAAGRPDLTAALTEAASGPPGTGVRTLPDGVYLIALAAVAEPAAGAPASPGDGAPALGTLVFARRLDAEFAVELRGLTGFDVAVLGAGRATVTTNPDAVASLGPLEALPTVGERSSVLFARVPLEAGTGSSAPSDGAELLLSTSLSAAQAATGQLPGLVAALAGATAAAAVVLALWLSRILDRRLGAVHAGLLDIAAGRRPAPLATSDDDPVDRLVEALGGLLAALERREATVRRSFEAVASVPIDRPPAEVATTLLDASDAIFGLRWSAIVEPDGTVFARSSRAPDLGDGRATSPTGAEVAIGPAADASRFVVADLDPRSARRTPEPGATPSIAAEAGVVDATDGSLAEVPARGRRLVALLPDTAEPDAAEAAEPSGSRTVWTPADEATLRLMAILIGAAVEDAERYATAAERAARLDRLNQLQRQFLRSISHNLKTPLATIGLALDDLADAVRDDPYLAHRAGAIRTEAARLGRLVEQVLTLSRIEAGTVDLAAGPLVPAEVAAAIWRELDVERPFRIDDRSGRRTVVADRRALEQILWNLLDNAVRYAPSGAIEVRIEVRAAASERPDGEEELAIAVLDEGPGVPPGERGRIFHRFTRGSTAGRQAGTGLGLSLARSLARLMGGDLVYVDRGPGAGACFTLRIPVGRPGAKVGSTTAGDRAAGRLDRSIDEPDGRGSARPAARRQATPTSLGSQPRTST
jgi:signal transduction histidine kinase